MPTTTIDNTWLTNNGGINGPWKITVAGTYELATDPVANGTGFLINVAGVTFDMKGHTITFNNATPPTVLNPYFSNNVTVPGLPDHWDVTGAPTASVVPITDHVYPQLGFRDWAPNCLKLTNFTTDQVVKSEPITITVAKVEHVCNVYVKTLNNPLHNSVKIEVVDNVTGVSIGYTLGTNGSASGYTEPFYFTPLTTNAVYIKITVSSTNAASTIAYLSGAQLGPSRDVGILLYGNAGVAGVITGATNASPIQITAASHGLITGNFVSIDAVGGNTASNGYWQVTKVDGNNFTLNGSTGNGAYTSGGLYCQNGLFIQVTGNFKQASQLINGFGGSPKFKQVIGAFTLKDTVGGNLIVAGHDGFSANPVIASGQATTVTITGINVQSAGSDSCGIQCGGSIPVITGCTITQNGTNFSNRQRQVGALNVTNVVGAPTISGNTIIGSTHTGILGSQSSTTPSNVVVVVDNNTIGVNSRYTDAWGIIWTDSRHGTTLISNNIINATCGRGIITDIYRISPATDQNVTISGNTITCYEKGNLEYGSNALECTGIEVRSHSAYLILNYSITNNTVTVSTDDVGDHACIAIRPEVYNQTTAPNFLVSGNTAVAYHSGTTTTPNTSFYCAAYGQHASRVGDIMVRNNTFESNDQSIALWDADNDTLTCNGVTFYNNVLKKSALGNQSFTYRPVAIGFYSIVVTACKLIGSTFSGGATGYTFNQTGAPGNPCWGDNNSVTKQVNIGWQVALTVTDSLSTLALPGATCVVKNVSSVQDDSQVTDAGGLATVNAITDLWSQLGNNAGGRTHTAYTPHTLTVSKAGYFSKIVNLGTLAANGTANVALDPIATPPVVIGMADIANNSNVPLPGGAILTF